MAWMDGVGLVVLRWEGGRLIKGPISSNQRAVIYGLRGDSRNWLAAKKKNRGEKFIYPPFILAIMIPAVDVRMGWKKRSWNFFRYQIYSRYLSDLSWLRLIAQKKWNNHKKRTNKNINKYLLDPHWIVEKNRDLYASTLTIVKCNLTLQKKIKFHLKTMITF